MEWIEKMNGSELLAPDIHKHLENQIKPPPHCQYKNLLKRQNTSLGSHQQMFEGVWRMSWSFSG